MTKLNSIVMRMIVCFVVSIVGACTTSATPTQTATPLPSATSGSISNEPSLINTTGGFFALSVADINASADWYSEKLDLNIVLQPPKTNQPTVVVLEGSGLIVELIQHDDAMPLSEVAPTIKDKMLIQGIVKVGVIVEDFDAAVEILRERDMTIAFGPFPATADQRANVIIQDNEGNLIQFFGK